MTGGAPVLLELLPSPGPLVEPSSDVAVVSLPSSSSPDDPGGGGWLVVPGADVEVVLPSVSVSPDPSESASPHAGTKRNNGKM
jgi:hypothetical protein